VTIVSEQLRHQAERLIERTIDGPVLACIDEGPCGRAVAWIAGSLARRLGARVLLATVAQAPPRTPAGGDFTSAMPAVRRSLDVTPNPWLAVTDSLDAAVDAVTDRPEPPSLGHLTS
jgi:hypothetical protein